MMWIMIHRFGRAIMEGDIIKLGFQPVPTHDISSFVRQVNAEELEEPQENGDKAKSKRELHPSFTYRSATDSYLSDFQEEMKQLPFKMNLEEA